MSNANADTVVFMERFLSDLHNGLRILRNDLTMLDRCTPSDLKHLAMIDLLEIISAREEEVETVRKLIRKGDAA